MTKEQIQDRCRGALPGGAVGDALGYAVEFSSLNAIRKKYGENGISDYDLNPDGIALFSDDTQMTLYTAEGLLEAVKNERPITPTICNAYLAWFGHQTGKKVKISYESELAKIDELNQRRAPGNTCLSALFSIYSGKEPSNNSKGCGGVMRVAPIGIYGATHGWKPEETGRMAAEAAELTHLHPLSTYSSMALAMIVRECILAESTDRARFRSIIESVFKPLGHQFRGDDNLADLFNLILKAMALAETEKSDIEAISLLGEGWVAEETLAIAVFSVTRYIDNFDKCVVCAVNHGGDSDSTGAVAGNIIGAILGYEAIPEKFTRHLQLRDLLLAMADKLSNQAL